MTDELIQQADGSFVLTGELSFKTVPSLVRLSHIWLASPADPVSINMEKVGRADSAGLALLLEWQKMALAANRKIRFTGIPDQLVSLIAICGLKDSFGI
ncbi:MAG: STAS domain-containing protein [Gammaproteobacteria bacterium]|nr:STAS domain-containing protein [Gammaproteobacteria bacterium]